MGAMMRDDRAHLRTRIPEGGMKYKGYNIAIHELGHNVEQVFSLNGIDYYSMNGVPEYSLYRGFCLRFSIPGHGGFGNRVTRPARLRHSRH